MQLSKQRQGELFIFVESILWSLFPIITVLSFNTLSPVLSLALSSFFSIFFFAAMITKKKIWHEVINRKAFKDILFATFIIGILYYLLTFWGLQYTSPGNASIIALTQGFFSFLLFHVFRKEHIPKSHIAGALLMIFGALIVLASSFKAFHMGDIMILAANAIAPIGNFFAQKARKEVNSETIMFIRSSISTVFVFILALIIQAPISLEAIQRSLPFLIINGIFLLGLSKILWLEGIHRISVTKANAQGSIVPLFTLFFAFLILNQLPTIYQILAIIPIIPGVILISRPNPQAAPEVE